MLNWRPGLYVPNPPFRIFFGHDTIPRRAQRDPHVANPNTSSFCRVFFTGSTRTSEHSLFLIQVSRSSPLPGERSLEFDGNTSAHAQVLILSTFYSRSPPSGRYDNLAALLIYSRRANDIELFL